MGQDGDRTPQPPSGTPGYPHQAVESGNEGELKKAAIATPQHVVVLRNGQVRPRSSHMRTHKCMMLTMWVITTLVWIGLAVTAVLVCVAMQDSWFKPSFTKNVDTVYVSDDDFYPDVDDGDYGKYIVSYDLPADKPAKKNGDWQYGFEYRLGKNDGNVNGGDYRLEALLKPGEEPWFCMSVALNNNPQVCSTSHPPATVLSSYYSGGVESVIVGFYRMPNDPISGPRAIRAKLTLEDEGGSNLGEALWMLIKIFVLLPIAVVLVCGAVALTIASIVITALFFVRRKQIAESEEYNLVTTA
eukprot:TRINITY_DN2239_c0_g1_i1.p1 TRINITY_DN2239_c0_g1~~TRINITY_DN2239_c0_g1_i1.p1  ORF type:complete len:300 (-),score=51.56 TRINITY_DN2239_c0_g1_i1:127-1026(-)